MPDLISVVLGIGKVIKGPFEVVEFIGKMCIHQIYHIGATHVQVPNQAGLLPVVRSQPINLPAGTAMITLHGGYWVRPPAANYAVFVRKQGVYWPQRRLNFGGHRTWDSEVHFGTVGVHHVIVAELSAEIEVLFEYYRNSVIQIRDAKADLTNALPGDKKDLAKTIPNFIGIDIGKHYLPGLKIIQEIEVKIGP